MLNVNYAGLILRNPVVVASSGLTSTPEKNELLYQAGAGAIVLKSLFEEQIEAEAQHLLQNNDYPEAFDYINNYTRENSIENYLTLIRESRKRCPIPIIASINCYNVSSWTEIAIAIQKAGAQAIELNIMAVAHDINAPYGAYEQLHIDILRAVRAKITIPIIIKLSRQITNIPALISQLKANGAAAVVLFNRMSQSDINISTKSIVPNNPFTAPSEFSNTLRWLGITSGLVKDIDLSASTGIYTTDDCIKALLAGATTVQLCSSLYTNGLSIIKPIIDEMATWMQKNNYCQINDFKGKISGISQKNLSLYERVQFMHYFSSKED